VIDEEELMDIRALARQGYTYAEIGRIVGRDWRTVKRYLEHGAQPVYRRKRMPSKLDRFKPLIDQWLAAQPRLLATRVHQDLVRDYGFEGGYDTVRRYVERSRPKPPARAEVRFETAPGFQAQVDWSHEEPIRTGSGLELPLYCFHTPRMALRPKEIERKYGMDSKTAWFMLHRIREAMKREPMAALLSGRVTADETWIGGKPSNRHGHKRGQGGQGRTDKTPVVALVCHETGEVRAEAIPDVTGETLAQVMAEQVDTANTHLQTDSSAAYTKLGKQFASHATVDHYAGEYVRGEVSTNAAENFFSQLKRSTSTEHITPSAGTI